MAENSLLHQQIIVALQCVRTARADGDKDLIVTAEKYLDRLLDRLEMAVPA